MSIISRSERIALNELELRNWCKESKVTPFAEDPITNIEFIHRSVVDIWVWNTEDLNQRAREVSVSLRLPWTDLNIIPPWNPTLSSIEDRIGLISDQAKGKLLPILQYRQNLAVDTLESPLLPEHISHIKSVCDEIEAELVEFDDEFDDDEFDFDNEEDAYWPMEGNDMVERIQNLEPRRLFQDDNNNKELCKKGLELLSEMMEKAKDINGIQGNYLELCNILKEIHNN